MIGPWKERPMARGLDRHRERLEALSLLGKNLTRRAGAKCELCEGTVGKVAALEIPPLPEEPEIERCALLCESCHRVVDGGRLSPDDLRFLETSAWSDLPVVQVMSVRLLRRLAEDSVHWASSLLDSLYLSPEVEEWLKAK